MNLNVAMVMWMLCAIFPSFAPNTSFASAAGVRKCSPRSWKQVVKLFHQNGQKACSSFIFTDSDLDRSQTLQLATFISTNGGKGGLLQRVRLIRLERVGIGGHSSTDGKPAGVEELAQALGRLPELLELSMAHNNLGNEGSRIVLAGLMRGRKVASVSFVDNSIGDAGASAIAQILTHSHRQHISTLDLSHNDIGGTGGLALAATLSSSHRLTSLSLKGNRLPTTHPASSEGEVSEGGDEQNVIAALIAAAHGIRHHKEVKLTIGKQRPKLQPTPAPTAPPPTPPTPSPTPSPSSSPTHAPSPLPTPLPSQSPTFLPTQSPTPVPSSSPTHTPTQAPSTTPTR